MEPLPYQSQTLLEFAYKSLKSDIAENRLVQGQKVILRELVERYGISETPIKQALNRLVTEGLVESIPRKGMRVRVIKCKEIENLFEIRNMMETYFIKNVIDHVKEHPQVLSDFLNILKKQEKILRKVLNTEEYYQFYDLDKEFHQLYIQCSRNDTVVQVYNTLGTHGYRYYAFGKLEMKQLVRGFEEHKLIYEALKGQNESELKRVIKLHIQNAKEEICNALKNESGVIKEVQG
jgi:DNA-binding GntR family transcriptional regulator